VAEKTWFFYPKTHFEPKFFLSKTLRKHSRNLVEPINGLQKYQKIAPKPKINPKLKKLFKFRYFFIGVFKVKKKTLNPNPPHYLEYFDIKIDCFGSLNLLLTTTFSLSQNSTISSLSSTQKRTKKIK
jgi:hypothetical protein